MTADKVAADPLTVSQLIARIEALAIRRPEILGWPVHILDMDDGDDGHRPDETWDCLVTEIETDQFTDKQGWVLSLVADHTPYRLNNPYSKESA